MGKQGEGKGRWEGQAGEERGKERQTERGIVGNVNLGEVENILCSLTLTSDSTLL